MKKHLPIFFLICLAGSTSHAQIGAEAQGGKMTTWAALGFDQEISKRCTSVTDFGYGRHSDPTNTAFLKRQGLVVLTQDFQFRINRHWAFDLSVGYWHRNFYTEDAPYNERAAPYQFRNELRPYQRIYYTHNLGSISIAHVFRSDFRFYYNQDFSDNWTTPFEFRARYTEKWKFPLSSNRKNSLILIDEVLTAIDHYSPGSHPGWSPYQFTENRLSGYYRRSFFNNKVDLDLGLMYQYWRERPGSPTFNNSFNLMVDLIFKDLFPGK